MNAQGLFIADRLPNSSPNIHDTVRILPNLWWTTPAALTLGSLRLIVIPHWLTNLLAWSLFIVLWRKCRNHPKGHCQQCGYDLTGNVSGRCPECDASVKGNETGMSD